MYMYMLEVIMINFTNIHVWLVFGYMVKYIIIPLAGWAQQGERRHWSHWATLGSRGVGSRMGAEPS